MVREVMVRMVFALRARPHHGVMKEDGEVR